MRSSLSDSDSDTVSCTLTGFGVNRDKVMTRSGVVCTWDAPLASLPADKVVVATGRNGILRHYDECDLGDEMQVVEVDMTARESVRNYVQTHPVLHLSLYNLPLTVTASVKRVDRGGTRMEVVASYAR